MNFSQACFDLAMDDGWDGVFATAPVLELYGGTMPAAPYMAVPSGTDHFLTMTLPTPPWGSASEGVKALTPTWAGTFGVGGTPTWFRVRESGDSEGIDTTVARIDGLIGTAAGSDILISHSTWLADESLEITSFSLVSSINSTMTLAARGTTL